MQAPCHPQPFCLHHYMMILPAPSCPLCPRLVTFRTENAQAFPHFFNGAVPAFGELSAELLITGLAPGLKGANATGRPFTGDYAGEVLYPALLKAGLAKQGAEVSIPSIEKHLGNYDISPAPHHFRPESLTLVNTRITNAVRCVPPENKPTPQETNNCNRFLKEEIAAMPRLKVILTLGQISHNAVLKTLGQKASAYKFGHAAEHRIGQLIVLNSYHTSRYNVNTNRLTFAMFDAIIAQAKGLLSAL